MTKHAILAGLLISLAASTAQAGDSWSGYYIGIDGGIVQTTAEAYAPNFIEGGVSQDWGGIVGVSAGYDKQFGDVVIGGVADISYIGTKDLYFGGKSNEVDASFNYDLNAVATARVRAGFAVNDQLLLYGTGGLSVAFIDGSFFDPLPSTRAGYVIGFGSEYKIQPNWSVKFEFLHHKFNDFSNEASIITPLEQAEVSLDSGGTNTLSSSLNTFKIGLNYRF